MELLVIGGGFLYVIITGASSGLGKELSYIFASKGYDLILVARRKQKLDTLKKHLDQLDVQVVIKALDLTNLDNCSILFEQIKSLDVSMLINNAGFGNVGFFSKTDLSKEMQMIDLNIKSLHYLTKLYLNNFNKGDIVNISSLAAFLPTPLHATYSATKSYVYYFSRAINYELKKQGNHVKVLTVAPGPIKTDFFIAANSTVNRGMDSKKCATLIYKGIKRRKTLIIPGFSMKLLYFFNKLMPHGLSTKLAYRIQKRK